MNHLLALGAGILMAAFVYAALFYRPSRRKEAKPPLVSQEPAVGARFNNLTSAPHPKKNINDKVAPYRDAPEG